jgi:hypothetical protein
MSAVIKIRQEWEFLFKFQEIDIVNLCLVWPPLEFQSLNNLANSSFDDEKNAKPEIDAPIELGPML